MSNQIFQIDGVVTNVEDKSKPVKDLTMVSITFDNMFEATAFRGVAHALLKMDLNLRRVCATIQAVPAKDERFTNYHLLHLSELDLGKVKR